MSDDELKTENEVADNLDALLRDMRERGRKQTVELKSKARQIQAEEKEALADPDVIEADAEQTKRVRGVSTQRIIEKGQLKLFEGEARGDYSQHPITPGRETPSIFARIPVFIPTRSRKYDPSKRDKDGAIVFETGHGKGRKFGPILNTYDEDTLLALLMLRQRQLVGKGEKLPIASFNPYSMEEDSVVHTLFTTVTEIQHTLGKGVGGRDLKLRLESVKRIAGVILEFEKISEKQEAVVKKQSFNTPILQVNTAELDDEAALYVQFPPAMVKWLKSAYTFIDLKLRAKLNDTGKAIYKYFASQQGETKISVEKLQKITGSPATKAKFLFELRKTMNVLESAGWLEYKIIGNGRTKPHVIHVSRAKKQELLQAQSDS